MKRYIVTARDILNSDPNYRPYAKLEQEQEVKDAIHKKYGFMPYQSDFTLVTLLYKEGYNYGIKLSEGVTQRLKECVTMKMGRENKNWTSNDWSFRGKICNKEGIYDKVNALREDFNTYQKQLNKYTNEIADSTDMQVADQIAAQIKHYHDSNFGIFLARKEQVLHDFEVEIMGIDPDD